MPTNLSMFQNAFMQPKSVAEYANDFGQIQNNALARTQSQMQIDAAKRATQQEDAYNQLAKGFGTDIQSNVNALRQGGLGARADTYLKAAQDAQEKAAKTSKDMAETEATKYKLQRTKYENGIKVLVGSQTPQDAIARIKKGVTDGAWSMQEAQQKIGEIPQDPNQFQDWRQRELLGIVSAKDQIEHALSLRQFDLNANNELIGADGKVNTTLLGAKKQIAQSGASSVNINNGQKGFENELKLRGDFKQEPVYKAHQEMQSAHSQIKQSLAQASPAGDLAGATKIMKLLDPGSVVRESELGMAMAATGLLDRVQNYASNIISGNKLTPKQRQEFQQLADALYGESVKAYNSKRGEYQKLGAEYGLNADRAVGAPASLAQKPRGGDGGGVVDFGSLK